MNTRYVLFLTLLTASGIVLTLRAQVVNDGTTATLSNVTTNITGDVTVGTNGSLTLLVLSDNALLTNSANGVIALNVTAKSNEVRLASPSARWLMGGNLFVGSNGAMNRLVVSNGAFLENNNGVLGSRLDSSNNLALVTGAGSVWSNRNDITVGTFGRNNQVIVSNGGWVAARNSRLGGNANGSNNLMLVTGSGSVWSNALTVFVGNAAPGKLVIEAGGLLHDDSGTIGGFGSASNSEALVTGPGARWNNVSSLTIGNNVGRNRLVVSNGAAVWSGSGLLGGVAAAVSNQVIVTGAGSVWSNQTSLYVGGSVGNRVEVSDGGHLASADGNIGAVFGANSNAVVLAGSGSIWNSRNNLIIGEGGNANVLIASNGATVLSSNATIGVNGSTANNNLALVAGAGTLWSNQNDFVVGSSGVGNRLQVDNGATVLSGNLFIGFNSLSANNRVAVNGGTLRVTNQTGNGTLDVRRGTNILNAGLIEADRLLVTNSTSQFEFNGGRLITRGAVITPRFFVGNSVTTPAIWDARAGEHRLANDLFIGNNSPFNQMLVTDGAVINSGRAGLIGGGSGAHSNTVFVSGPGSRWLLDEEELLYVGYGGVFNRLIVTNGGVVEAASCIVGGENNATNCEAIITGPGSVLSSALFALQIGSTGSTNRVRVENGGRLMGDFQVGRTVNSVGNVLWVTDPGSRAQTSVQFVGYDGPASVLMIGNGAAVQGNEATIGLNASSGNNLAVVTGSGSVWSNATTLYVGSGGRSNQLLVSDGGVVRDRLSYVGFNATSSGNRAMVTGSGSLWSNQFELYLGFGGAGNQLVVSEGGAVRNSISTVGLNASSSNNLAVVTGHDSVWSNTFEFYLGFGGAGNQLVVSDGAALYNSMGTVGSGVSSSNNLAVVTGAGSVWTNFDELYVGHSGRGNQLVVSNGGTVFAEFNRNVGFNGGANSNSVLVTGAGSAWLGDDSLYVGSGGAFNQLLVNKGGRVTSGPGTIGGGSAAKSNRVEVTDAGSMWINLFDLTVGEAGEANQLVVSNGALIVSSNGIVGFGAAGDGNAALVSGGGSVWRNQQTLTIGDSGSGNQLEVSQGARVESRFATLGAFASARNNRAVVTGPGSSWTIEQVAMVGVSGSGSRLVISDGGLVVAGGSGAVLTIGDGPDSASNEVLITGPGSTYSNTAGINIEVGNRGYSNRMGIENGGLLVANPIIGGEQTSTGNVLTVTGPGSRIVVPRNDLELIVGGDGPGNFLVVSNGAVVLGDGAAIGYDTTSSNNLAVVTGSGSVWSNQNVVQVGYFGRNNRLLIADGGTVSSTNAVNVGFRTTTSSNNLLHVVNGTLRVTNRVGTGRLDIRSGTNRLDAGLVDVDRLVLTNALGTFEFNGGTLITRGALINNSTVFSMGNSGGTAAVWDIRAGASDHFVAGSLRVGVDSSFNQLILTNGALLTNLGSATLGSFPVARSNSVTLAGAGSRWRLGDGVAVGDFGSGNRLGVSNGASLVTDSFSYLGVEFVSTNNEAVVTGPGSSWTSGPGELFVGYRGRDNRLLVSDGGRVVGFAGTIGDFANSTNNLAVVTGAGSSWSNATALHVGNAGSGNRLQISEGGTVFASNLVSIGTQATSSNNLLYVNGGTLRSQNAGGTGRLDIRGGTNRLDAGLVDVDRLTISDPRGFFEFNGGTLRTAGTTIGTGQILNVGNGASTATLELRGGTHVMLSGLVVANHAFLTGSGSVPGAHTVQAGGQLVPGASGASIGKIIFNTSPLLQGTVVMEISRNGPALTNDLIQVITVLTYGGSLIVSNPGPDALVAGDRFRLFAASAYLGSFTNLSLPPLGPGLGWRNDLTVDGAITVVAVSSPGFSAISRVGTNVVIAGTNGTPGANYTMLASTNVALPLSNWVSLATKQFDASGHFSFTNAIVPEIAQRFFLLRTP